MEDGAARAEAWRNGVRNHADNLVRRPVDQIDAGDVLRVVGKLRTDRHDTAKKVRRRLPSAFGWAMATGHRPDDTAGEALLAALPRQVAEVLAVDEDHRALDMKHPPGDGIEVSRPAGGE